MSTILQSLFKFDCFEFKVDTQLIKLLFEAVLFVQHVLVKDLVEVSLPLVPCLFLCVHQLPQLLAYFYGTHLIVIKTESLNELKGV